LVFLPLPFFFPGDFLDLLFVFGLGDFSIGDGEGEREGEGEGEGDLDLLFFPLPLVGDFSLVGDLDFDLVGNFFSW